MSKTKIGLIALMAALFLLGSFSVVGAQTQTPQDPDGDTPTWPWMGRGPHRMGAHMMWNTDGAQSGLLHDTILPLLAEKLGLTVDEITARLEDGERMWEIADSLGYTFDDFRALMLEAREEAIAQALEDGTITEDQAEWMQERGANMMGRQNGSGRGAGMMGGWGRNQNSTTGCPFYNGD